MSKMQLQKIRLPLVIISWHYRESTFIRGLFKATVKLIKFKANFPVLIKKCENVNVFLRFIKLFSQTE